MGELPFLVVLIRRLRAVAVWVVAVVFAVLLYFDFTEDEYYISFQWKQTLAIDKSLPSKHRLLFLRIE